MCSIDDPLSESENIDTKNLQNQCGHQGKVHKKKINTVVLLLGFKMKKKKKKKKKKINSSLFLLAGALISQLA